MKTIKELLDLSTEFLGKRRQAEEVLSSALGMSRLDLYLHFDKPVREGELQRCREILKQRADGEPIQYIDGKVSFCGAQIAVNSAVLIPRPETEVLVDRVISKVEQGIFWDLCCGSGCVGIAMKKARPELEVYASDLSSDALEVAKGNAGKNEVEVNFLLGDLCAPMRGISADYVVCNPPYVSEAEYLSLEPEVLREPRGALVAGPVGTEIYCRLAEELPHVMRPGGKLWLEIGATQAEAVEEIFSGSNWKVLSADEDWSGLPRFFSLERQ